MDLNDKKERFSLAYISAVAAHAGFQVVEPHVDKDSVDGILMAETGPRPRIEFQAKATARSVTKSEEIAFALPIKNYNDLRAAVIVPRLLIVVCLPEAETDWLIHSQEELRLRRCGYWLSLAEFAKSDNTTSVTVHLPRHQMFESSQLVGLMDRAAQGLPL